MIIRRMRANFGCLKNAELLLEPGLNIIEAPNESGKSTWCAFLRCMLYGIDSSRRGGFSDRQRYAPWDASPMEGQLQLTHDDKDITLYRRSLNAPMRDFAALYTGSGEMVGGLGPTDAGQQLTGFSESVFERSAFVRQGAIPVDNNPELEKRLSALLTTGEEGSSFAEAEQRLLAWQRSRRGRGRGHIPVLEAEIASIRGELDGIDTLEAELSELEAEAESAGETWKTHLQRSEREIESRREKLETARAELSKLEEAALAAERSCGPVPQPPQLHHGLWLLWAVVVFAAVTALVFRQLWGIILLAVGAFGAVWEGMRRRQQRQALQDYEETCERRREQQAYAAARWREAENAAAALRISEAELLRPDTKEQTELREAEQLFRAARERCAVKTGELKSRGERPILESRLRSLEEELQREEKRYAALGTALEELRGAYEELQSRFSPMLARRTAVLFSRLTDGRYSEVLLQQSLTALVQRRGDNVPHESVFLSRGTAEQLYLALRLALLELLDPEGRCPLVLDDVFVSFDGERLRLAMELLLEISRKRQIILFTCQKRERKTLERIKKADR